MGASVCAMASMVEAKRDGRLDPREVASVDRHLAACAACRALDRALDRLAAMVRRPQPPRGSQAHRRGRDRLLRAALIEVVPEGATPVPVLLPAPEAAPPATRHRLTGLNIAAALSLALGLLPGPREALSPRLRHLPPPPRLAVAPPPPASAAPESVVEAPAAAPPVASAAPRPPRAPSRPAAGSAPEPAPDPAPDPAAFAEGVALIGRGDFAAAAARLSAFAAQRPGDARAEDADFLAVVALQRAGRRAEAAAAARRYLDRHPRGYRRAEAQAVAGD